MDLTTAVLSKYAGGQLRAAYAKTSEYLQGEVEQAWVEQGKNGTIVLRVKFVWLARGDMPENLWTKVSWRNEENLECAFIVHPSYRIQGLRDDSLIVGRIDPPSFSIVLQFFPPKKDLLDNPSRALDFFSVNKPAIKSTF